MRVLMQVPSFDNKVAMLLLEAELGGPWTTFYSELSETPIAAASLGQVYKGRLLDGAPVAVKVQRPNVVETVSVDLFIIRCAAPSSCHPPASASNQCCHDVASTSDPPLPCPGGT